MTHKPKNPYCEACVRAKKTESPSYKGSYVRTVAEWGREVTADHITSLKDRMLGITGDRDALTIKDEYSGLKNLYPTKTKNADEMILKWPSWSSLAIGQSQICIPISLEKFLKSCAILISCPRTVFLASPAPIRWWNVPTGTS